MRIVTYNIQYWTGMDGRQDAERTIATIQEMQPDILAMQEVVHPYPLADGSTALEKVAQTLDGSYIFTPIWPAGTLPHISQPMGLALVSRYPIQAHASHRLSHTGPGETRWLLEARLLLNEDHPFTVYVTHLEWRWEDVRVQQVRALLQWTTRDRGRPHVLIGDFNTVHPDDVAHFEAQGRSWREFALSVQEGFPQAAPEPQAIAHILKAGYVDAFAAVGEGDGRTYTTGQTLLRLDYCFVDPSMREWLVRARRWESELARVASDHFPLCVDLEPRWA